MYIFIPYNQVVNELVESRGKTSYLPNKFCIPQPLNLRQ